MDELENSLALLGEIQRRTALNVFLQEYVRWLAGILAGLLLAAALSPALYWAFIAAAMLMLAGLTVAAVASRRKRPSKYAAAQMADRAAGLKDRIATAIYFAGTGEVTPLILRQRADAVEHASRVETVRLFPVRTPSATRYAVALFLLVGALFAYRLNAPAPLLALMKRAGETKLVRALVTPIVNAVNREQKPRNGEKQPGDASNDGQNAGNSRKRGENSEGERADNRARGGQQNSNAQAEAERRKQQEEQQQEQQKSQQQAGNQGEQQEGKDGSDQQGNGSQQRQGNGKQQQAGNNGQQGNQGGQQKGSEGAAGRGQSLAQSIMQAVKNLFSKLNSSQTSPAQGQSAQNDSQQDQNGSQPQSGQQAQNQGNQGANQSQQPGSQGQPQQQGQNQKGGLQAGSQAGVGDDAANEFLAANAKPEVVDVPVQQFTGQAQVRARAGDGIVSTPARSAATPSVSSPSGAEQENVPLRYRAYVQRYFDHTKKARK